MRPNKSPYDWAALRTEFLAFDGNRGKFFKTKGIPKSTWTRHTGPEWDQTKAAHKDKVSARVEEKLVEKSAETIAQVLQRQAKMGKAASTLGFQNLFVDEVDPKTKKKTGQRVLRSDLHASDMVRLVQLGLTAEFRATAGLKAIEGPKDINPLPVAPVLNPREDTEKLRAIMLGNPDVRKHFEAGIAAMYKAEKKAEVPAVEVLPPIPTTESFVPAPKEEPEDAEPIFPVVGPIATAEEEEEDEGDLIVPVVVYPAPQSPA